MKIGYKGRSLNQIKAVFKKRNSSLLLFFFILLFKTSTKNSTVFYKNRMIRLVRIYQFYLRNIPKLSCFYDWQPTAID